MKRFTLFMLITILLFAASASADSAKLIPFKFKNADQVVYSHEFHLKKYNNNCKVCHDAIFHLTSKKRYTMAEMEKGKSCGACHSGAKAFSVAAEKDCDKCHKGKPRDITYNIKGLGDAVFSHAIHIYRTGGACRACHDGVIVPGKVKFISMVEMEKGKGCGACHNGKRSFSVTANCERCHRGLKPRDITFALKGVAPATFSHALHIKNFLCKDCHTKTFPYKALVGKASMDDMSKGKSCGTCHNGKDAFATSGDCEKCHKGYKPGVVTFKNAGGDANFSHDFHLQSYKCSECHPKLFPFKAGTLKASMVEMEKGKSCGACHNKGKDAFTVADNCDKCHKM